LKNYKGQTLVHTDGTTLLGSDDKSGVAEIMTLADYLLNINPDFEHGEIRVGFGPDEEIGVGADKFDVADFEVLQVVHHLQCKQSQHQSQLR
ncbi:hypothetical protein ACI3PM_17420, partial [Lactiplantibacillus plantarum]